MRFSTNKMMTTKSFIMTEQYSNLALDFIFSESRSWTQLGHFTNLDGQRNGRYLTSFKDTITPSKNIYVINKSHVIMSYHRPSPPQFLEPCAYDYQRFPYNRELRAFSAFKSDADLQVAHRFVWLWVHSRLPEAIRTTVLKSGLSYYGLRPAIIPKESGDITIVVSKDGTEEEAEGLEMAVEGVLEGFGVFERAVRVVEL